MIKKIVILIAFVFSCIVQAQQGGTSSPYSFFGIGLQQFKGTIENRAIGGLSLYSDSLHLNLTNPAQLGKLRFVNFTVGGNHAATTLKEVGNESNTTDTTFDYFALGFPVSKKGAVSFGLMPWSSVGYNINASSDQEVSEFTGAGGVNRVFLSSGYEVRKGLYMGVTAAYYFGNIQNEAILTREQVELSTQEVNRTDFSGLAWEFGAQYETVLSNKMELRSSLQYKTASTISAENTRAISSGIFDDFGGFIEADIVDSIIQDTDFSLPSSVTIGVGLGMPNKWFVGGEYENSKTSNFLNNSFRTEGVNFVDSNSFKIGGLYTPGYNSIASYLERITYRAGLRYEELGLRVSNQDINEFGISFGVGLPTKRDISNLNVTFEYGQRGTTEVNLVQENFFNIGISLSLNDVWFLKAKFN